MLTIRFTRKGKKNQPFFRIVVVDKRRSSKGGRAVEDLGFMDPLKKRKSLNKERILYWISKGAQPSDTVHNLFVSEKIIEGKKIGVVKAVKKVEEIKSETPSTSSGQAPATETPASPVAEIPAPVVEATVSAVETPAEQPKA